MEAKEKQEYTLYLKALGAYIRSLRKERGWTLRDMVVEHGFHLSVWQGYESGRTGGTLFSLLRVAKAFGLPASELLRGVEASVPPPQSNRPTEARTKVTRKRTGGAKPS